MPAGVEHRCVCKSCLFFSVSSAGGRAAAKSNQGAAHASRRAAHVRAGQGMCVRMAGCLRCVLCCMAATALVESVRLACRKLPSPVAQLRQEAGCPWPVRCPMPLSMQSLRGNCGWRGAGQARGGLQPAWPEDSPQVRLGSMQLRSLHACFFPFFPEFAPCTLMMSTCMHPAHLC